MAVAWPEDVPERPLSSSFGVPQPFAGWWVSEFDDGPPLARPSSSMRTAEVTETIRMSGAEYAAFDQWLFVTAAQGTMPFTKQIHKPGAEMVTRTCRFLDQPSVSPVAPDLYDVSYTLSVENY